MNLTALCTLKWDIPEYAFLNKLEQHQNPMQTSYYMQQYSAILWQRLISLLDRPNLLPCSKMWYFWQTECIE